jgi:hypothetical protein
VRSVHILYKQVKHALVLCSAVLACCIANNISRSTRHREISSRSAGTQQDPGAQNSHCIRLVNTEAQGTQSGYGVNEAAALCS